MAWPDRKAGVPYDEDGRQELVAAGWTLVDADPEAIQAVLGGAAKVEPEWASPADFATERERDIMVQLAVHGVREVPEIGHETAGGFALSLAWPELMLGVLDGSDGRTELEAAGWTIVAPEVSAILDALSTKGA